MTPSSPSSSEPTASWSGEPTTQLDLRGEICPFTFVRARLQLEQMALGDTLRLIVDHEPATRNIPRSAVQWGQAVEAVTLLPGGEWEIVLRKCVQ